MANERGAVTFTEKQSRTESLLLPLLGQLEALKVGALPEPTDVLFSHLCPRLIAEA
jgi:hypothetical protein